MRQNTFIQVEEFFALWQSLQDEDGVATTPGIPEDLMKQWSDNDQVKQFRDDLVDMFGTLEDAKATPPAKRSGSHLEEPSTTKRGRAVGPESISKLEDLKGEERHKAGGS